MVFKRMRKEVSFEIMIIPHFALFL